MSAAGFIATSTSGRSPAVRMSWSAKWTWNRRRRGASRRGRGSRREVGERREVVAEGGRLAREAVAGELHPVTRVREADDHALQLLDPLDAAHPHRSVAPGRRAARDGPPARRLVPVGPCRTPLLSRASRAGSVPVRLDSSSSARRSTVPIVPPARARVWNPYLTPASSQAVAARGGRPRPPPTRTARRVDLVGPAEEVPFRLVLGAALDREACPQACRRRPRELLAAGVGLLGRGASAYPFAIRPSIYPSAARRRR